MSYSGQQYKRSKSPFLYLLAISLLLLPSFCFAKNEKEQDKLFILKTTQKVYKDSLLSKFFSKEKTDSILSIPIKEMTANVTGQLVTQTVQTLFVNKQYNATIQYISAVQYRLKQWLPNETESQKKLLNLSYLLVMSYVHLGLLEQAIKTSSSALSEAEENGLKGEAALMYNCLGYIHYMEKLYDKANAYYLKAISINDSLKNRTNLFKNYSNLSSSLGMQHEYNKAIEYAYLAIHQLDRENDKETEMICLRNIAGIYYLNKEYSLALKILQEVKGYQVLQQQKHNLIDTYYIMYLVFNAENKSDSSLYYLNNGIKLTKELDQLSDEAKFLEAYAFHSSLHHQYEQAYRFLNEASSIKDSVANIENQKRIENITNLYTEEQMRLNENLNMQEANARKASQIKWIVIIAIIFLIGVIGFLLWKINQIRKVASIHFQERLETKDQSIKEKQERISMLNDKIGIYESQLKLKEVQLTSLSLDLMREEEFISTLREDLRLLLEKFNPKNISQKEHLYKLISILNQHESGGISDEFKFHFENIHPDFYENLSRSFPSLTSKDLRLCALLKMGLATKEIADITFREPRSVESARNRLRKKCNIPQQEDLTKFFAGF